MRDRPRGFRYTFPSAAYRGVTGPITRSIRNQQIRFSTMVTLKLGPPWRRIVVSPAKRNSTSRSMWKRSRLSATTHAQSLRGEGALLTGSAVIDRRDQLCFTARCSCKTDSGLVGC